jgi:phage-related baseplate assembly protein
MAPEAYTLKSGLDGWIDGESRDRIRERAAVAHDKYQKCGSRGASRLFTTGW